jgi:hypothetical protein
LLEHQGRCRPDFDYRHADLALDRVPKTPHHSLYADPPLPPPVKVNQKAGIGQRQKSQKNYVRSTHEFDTTDG